MGSRLLIVPLALPVSVHDGLGECNDEANEENPHASVCLTSDRSRHPPRPAPSRNAQELARGALVAA
jgi:hypothetical protein